VVHIRRFRRSQICRGRISVSLTDVGHSRFSLVLMTWCAEATRALPPAGVALRISAQLRVGV
jgi:hypothetical protein